jgi:hypothetical protein
MIITPPKLKFVRIANRGIHDQERVHLEALVDCDSSFFVLIATIEFAEGRIFSGGRPCFWFDKQYFEAGDGVIVYSKEGRYSRQLRPDGHYDHFFFWGVQGTLFGAPTARVVITELTDWITGG